MPFRLHKTLVLKSLLCAIALAGCAPAAVPSVKPPESYNGPIVEAPVPQAGDFGTYEVASGTNFRSGAENVLKNPKLSFPLWIGKRWSYEFEITRVSGRSLHPKAPSRANDECEVTAFEKVTVKAGTFDAFACKCKCEMVGTPLIWNEYCGTTIIWYAPAVKNIVRHKTESTESSYELTAFRLSKRGIEPTSYVPQDADDFVDRGNTYLDRRDYDHAIVEYNRAIELDPKNGSAFFYRAWARGDKKEYDGAVDDYTRYIELNPNDAAAFNNRGNIYRDRKDYDLGLQDYTRAVELNPKYALAFYNRGVLYAQKKDYDRAIRDYDESIRLNPRYSAAYNNRGNAYRDKKEYDRAIQDYSEAIRITPTYAAAFNNRASAFRNKQEYERALADYEAAARIDSRVAQFRFMGYVQFYMGDIPKSAERMERAVKAAPQNVYAVIWRYLTTAKTGDLRSAARELGDNAAKLREKSWPAPIVDFYLDKIDEKAMYAAAQDEDATKASEHVCEANFYAAEARLLKGMTEQAAALLRTAEKDCPPGFHEAHAARAELKRLVR
ncbi:MAG TPA: tetratricopeptide repeat protein [Candidatus Binatia bacterium]|nr:tetratricopeptide repeat protein [Candidatus Binatia bacterium]